MADRIGQDDEIARSVERLAGAEQFVGEEGPRRELRAAAAGAVQDHHGIVDKALGVAVRGADGAVMLAQFGENLAGAEAEIADYEVTLRRRPLGIGRRGAQHQRQQRRQQTDDHSVLP